MMKLNAVGLRGAAELKPEALSGGMARRVALARAIALDPMLIMYDEPFTGLDPISTGVIANLIRRLNDALGATSIVVTHDVEESFKIVDYVYFVSAGNDRGRRHARFAVPLGGAVRAAVRPRRDRRAGAVPLPSANLCRRPRAGAPAMIGALDRGFRHIGHMVVDGVWKLGVATRFSWFVLIRSGDCVRRFQLTLNEIYFSGTLSLIIIIVSGLFVGLVLGLQGYETLKRYGSAEALGTLVALALVRELGPVVSALLFASRAGSAITAKIGIMKATEQLSAMEMMAVDPFARVLISYLLGRCDIDAAAGGHIQRDGHVRRLSDRRGHHRRRLRAPSGLRCRPTSTCARIFSTA